MESDLQFTSKEPVFLHLAVETLCGGSEGEGRGQIGEKQKREKRQVVLVTERKIIEIVTSRAAFIILLPSG